VIIPDLPLRIGDETNPWATHYEWSFSNSKSEGRTGSAAVEQVTSRTTACETTPNERSEKLLRICGHYPDEHKGLITALLMPPHGIRDCDRPSRLVPIMANPLTSSWLIR